MASRPTLISAGQAENYYHLKDSIHEKDTSKWLGSLAKDEGLEGKTVEQSDLIRIGYGFDKEGQPQFRKDHQERGFIDLTINAPKSFSVLSTVDPNLSEAMTATIERTTEWLDKNYSQFRITKDGKTTVQDGEGLLMAGIRHGTSRENDPQEHAHILIATQTRRPDGKTVALFNDKMFVDQQLITSVSMSFLAEETQKRGYQTEAKGNSFEIKGVPSELCDLFSKRSGQVDKLSAELREKYPSLPDGKIHNLASMGSRHKKKVIDKGILRDSWNAQANTLGYNLKEIAQQAKGQSQEQSGLSAVDHVALSAIVQTFDKTVAPQEAIITGALQSSRGELTIADITKATTSMIKSGDLIQTQYGGITTPQIVSDTPDLLIADTRRVIDDKRQSIACVGLEVSPFDKNSKGTITALDDKKGIATVEFSKKGQTEKFHKDFKIAELKGYKNHKQIVSGKDYVAGEVQTVNPQHYSPSDTKHWGKSFNPVEYKPTVSDHLLVEQDNRITYTEPRRHNITRGSYNRKSKEFQSVRQVVGGHNHGDIVKTSVHSKGAGRTKTVSTDTKKFDGTLIKATEKVRKSGLIESRDKVESFIHPDGTRSKCIKEQIRVGNKVQGTTTMFHDNGLIEKQTWSGAYGTFDKQLQIINSKTEVMNDEKLAYRTINSTGQQIFDTVGSMALNGLQGVGASVSGFFGLFTTAKVGDMSVQFHTSADGKSTNTVMKNGETVGTVNKDMTVQLGQRVSMVDRGNIGTVKSIEDQTISVEFNGRNGKFEKQFSVSQMIDAKSNKPLTLGNKVPEQPSVSVAGEKKADMVDKLLHFCEQTGAKVSALFGLVPSIAQRMQSHEKAMELASAKAQTLDISPGQTVQIPRRKDLDSMGVIKALDHKTGMAKIECFNTKDKKKCIRHIPISSLSAKKQQEQVATAEITVQNKDKGKKQPMSMPVLMVGMKVLCQDKGNIGLVKSIDAEKKTASIEFQRNGKKVGQNPSINVSDLREKESGKSFVLTPPKVEKEKIEAPKLIDKLAQLEKAMEKALDNDKPKKQEQKARLGGKGLTL